MLQLKHQIAPYMHINRYTLGANCITYMDIVDITSKQQLFLGIRIIWLKYGLYCHILIPYNISMVWTNQIEAGPPTKGKKARFKGP